MHLVTIIFLFLVPIIGQTSAEINYDVKDNASSMQIENSSKLHPTSTPVIIVRNRNSTQNQMLLTKVNSQQYVKGTASNGSRVWLRRRWFVYTTPSTCVPHFVCHTSARTCPFRCLEMMTSVRIFISFCPEDYTPSTEPPTSTTTTCTTTTCTTTTTIQECTTITSITCACPISCASSTIIRCMTTSTPVVSCITSSPRVCTTLIKNRKCCKVRQNVVHLFKPNQYQIET